MTKSKFTSGLDRTGGFYRFYRGGRTKELKFFDTSLAFNIDFTGEVPATGQLNLIPQGTTPITRVGQHCIIKEIEIIGQIGYVPGADTNGTSLSVIHLVLDTQCNGAAAAVTDVLTSNALTVAVPNIGNSQRFKILKTWRFAFHAGAGVSGAYSQDLRHWVWKHKCSIPIEFADSNTDGAITGIRSNNLFLLAGSDSTADDEVNAAATCRLRFSDPM